MSNIVVIGMGYVGIPGAALLADVPGVPGNRGIAVAQALRMED